MRTKAISTFILLNKFSLLYQGFLNHHTSSLGTMWISHRVYMSRICRRRIFFMLVQSYFAIISREWCFPCDMNVISSARAMAVAENWKYLGNASYIIRKKISQKKSGPLVDVGSVISNRPTFGRVAATDPIREFRSEWRLHYSGVIGFLAADVIVAVISDSHSPRICIWLKIYTRTCVYLFYIGIHASFST